jgi:hypothetical protein
MEIKGTDFGDDFLESPIKEEQIPVEPVVKAEKKGKVEKPVVEEKIIEDKPEVEIDDEPVKTKGTKEAPEPEEEEEEVTEGLVNALAAKLGYEFGEDEEYEETEEGLVQFIQKQQQVGAQEIVENYFNNVHPKGGEFFDLINMISDLSESEQGDIIEEFFKGKSPELDYSSINLEDENTQKSVLKTFYRASGFSDEQINKKLDKFEIAGMLQEEAEEASELLAKMQKEESKKVIEREKQEQVQRRQQNDRYYSALRQTIESGKVNNFTIPVNERKATFEYIAKGDALNKLNEMWSTIEGRTQLALLLKNDFKLDKYINQAAKTQVVTGLRDKLKAGASKLKSSDPRSNTYDNDWDDGEVSYARK